jgi:hypothetical protein
MPDVHFAALAGEHFVAYKVAMLGFIPALLRQNGRGVDMLVSHPESGMSVALQVKSAESAVRERRKRDNGESFHVRFPLGQRAIENTADDTIFCFVDLRTRAEDEIADVYIVPAVDLKREYAGSIIRKYRYAQHHRPVSAMERYRNNWDPLVAALTAAPGQQLVNDSLR